MLLKLSYWSPRWLSACTSPSPSTIIPSTILPISSLFEHYFAPASSCSWNKLSGFGNAALQLQRTAQLIHLLEIIVDRIQTAIGYFLIFLFLNFFFGGGREFMESEVAPQLVYTFLLLYLHLFFFTLN